MVPETPTDRAGQVAQKETFGGKTAEELWTLLEEIGGPKTAEWDSIHVHAKAYQAAIDALPELLGTATRVESLAKLVGRCNDEWYLRCVAADAEVASLRAALDAAEAERDQLRAALRNYGEHRDWCAFRDDTVSCSCGFDLALGGNEG